MAFALNEKRVKDPIEKKTLPDTKTLERYGACASFELNEMSKVIVQWFLVLLDGHANESHAYLNSC
jgi:hypothetical protein